MRSLASLLVALCTSAVLLVGCDGSRPLEPSATDDRSLARAVSQLAAPTLTSVSTSWRNQSESQVDITWQDNSTNETGFEIHRSATGEDGTYSVIARTGANTGAGTDAGVLLGTQYCYRVRAVRLIANKATNSAFSNTVCATTPSVAPLGAPSSVGAVAASQSEIDISWQDRSSGETGFEVWGNALLARTAADSTVFTHTGLTPNTGYCYRIRAFGVAGDDTTYSPFSNGACATTPNGPPAPVSSIDAYPYSGSGVFVSWGLSSGATSYGVDRSTDGGRAWRRVGTGSGSFYDQPLPSEQQVCYRVVASNELGDAQPSPTACATPGPAAPTALTARQVESGALGLTWIDNSAVEDTYEVRYLYPQCGNDGFGNWYCYDDDIILAELPANSTTYRLPSWVGAESVGRVSVYARRDYVYSDPAYATYVTAP